MELQSIQAFPFQETFFSGISTKATSSVSGYFPAENADFKSKWNRATPSVSVDMKAGPEGNNIRATTRAKHDNDEDVEKTYAPLPILASCRPRAAIGRGSDGAQVDPIVICACPYGILAAWNPGTEEKTVIVRKASIPLRNVESRLDQLAAVDAVSFKTTVSEAFKEELRGQYNNRRGGRGGGGRGPQYVTKTRTVEKMISLIACVSKGFVGFLVWDGKARDMDPSSFKPVLNVSNDDDYQCEMIKLFFSPSGTHLAVLRQQRGVKDGRMQAPTISIISVSPSASTLSQSFQKVNWIAANCTDISWVSDDLMLVNDPKRGVLKLYALEGRTLKEVGGGPRQQIPNETGFSVAAPTIKAVRFVGSSSTRGCSSYPSMIDAVVMDSESILQHVRLVSEDETIEVEVPAPAGESVPSTERGKRGREDDGKDQTVIRLVSAQKYRVVPISSTLEVAPLHHGGAIENIDIAPSPSSSSDGGEVLITTSSCQGGNYSVSLLRSASSSMSIVKNWTRPMKVASSSGVHKLPEKKRLPRSCAFSFGFGGLSVAKGSPGAIVLVHDEFCGTLV